MRRRMSFVLASAAILAAVPGAVPARATDWPQLQRDAARTGRTTDAVEPPYRARWIWMGPTLTLRNRDSVPGWPDDLTARPGYSYPMPAAVDFTIAEPVQPIVLSGRIFVGTMEGRAHAIAAHDGATLWSADVPGGTVASAAASAVAGGVVAFASVPGTVHAFRAADGAPLWTYTCRKAITGAPAELDGTFYVADHAGFVYALDAATGRLAWRSARLPAPVHGGLAATADRVYTGAEDMTIVALDRATGALRASRRLENGMSFRMLHPVVHGGIAWFQVNTLPVVGSEYVMEQVMADATSLAHEETLIARWLDGDDDGGRWPDASRDWNHLFALDAATLEPRFRVLAGPVEGCGHPAEPPAIDNAGRVLTWWKTRYPKLTTVGTFGSNYSIDLAAVNTANGRRVPIDNGHPSGMWPIETDNLYALSVGGNQVFLRQAFRGTQAIRLTDSTHRLVQAEIRNRDGGIFNADVVYGDQPRADGEYVAANQNQVLGHAAPVVSGSLVLISERFGVTAMEHRP